MERKEQIMKQL